MRPQRYWRLEKPHPLHTASVAQLKQEFAHLLVEAVRRRLPPGAPAYISLSAGGDSRAILGILKEQLRVDDVRCFSYALGRLQPDSDEVLAQQMAALYGYEHRMLDSFDGDVVGAIKNNARWGSGLTGVCDEMATWQTLHKEVAEASGPRPILFTGETANARADYHLSSVEDVIAAAKLKDFSVLPWLEPILGAESFAAMDARAKEAIAENVARCPPTDTLIGMRQVLWLQQRDRLYLPWREYFAGRFSTVGLPMLDDDVLDFVLRLPDELHRGRRLYDVVVKEMMPALFAIPSARSSSYARYWPEALREQAPQIRAFVESFDSPFDDVVAPDVLLRALELNSAWRQHSQSLLTKVLKKGYRLLKRTWLRESGLMTASQLKRPVEPHVFLKRALLLRTYLANASQQAPLVTPAVQER